MKRDISDQLDGVVKRNEEFWNKCRTKLCAQSMQQFGQCRSSGGVEEPASPWVKMADSFSAQGNEFFSTQSNKKQSPGNMHRRNHISIMLLKPFLKKLVLHMPFTFR